MSDLTNEQIEKYRKIVKNAPENAESYDLCWERYILDYDYDYSGEDLDMLKAIIAQHDRIAELEREREQRDLEQQIKVLKGFAEHYECEAVKRGAARYIEQLRKGAGDG